MLLRSINAAGFRSTLTHLATGSSRRKMPTSDYQSFGFYRGFLENWKKKTLPPAPLPPIRVDFVGVGIFRLTYPTRFAILVATMRKPENKESLMSIKQGGKLRLVKPSDNVVERRNPQIMFLRVLLGLSLSNAAIKVGLFLMDRTLNWGKTTEQVTVDEVMNGRKTYYNLGTGLMKSSAHRGIQELSQSGLFSFVRIPSSWDYTVSLNLDKLNETYDLLFHGGAMNDSGIKAIENIVETAQKASEQKTKKIRKKSAASKLSVDNLKQYINDAMKKKHGIVMKSWSPKTYGQAKHFLAECTKNDYNPIELIDSIMQDWHDITSYLYEISGAIFVKSDKFDFGVFYPYRGHIYDFLKVAQKLQHGSKSARNVLNELQNLGVDVIEGKDLRCKVKNLRKIKAELAEMERITSATTDYEVEVVL